MYISYVTLEFIHLPAQWSASRLRPLRLLARHMALPGLSGWPGIPESKSASSYARAHRARQSPLDPLVAVLRRPDSAASSSSCGSASGTGSNGSDVLTGRSPTNGQQQIPSAAPLLWPGMVWARGAAREGGFRIKSCISAKASQADSGTLQFYRAKRAEEQRSRSRPGPHAGTNPPAGPTHPHRSASEASTRRASMFHVLLALTPVPPRREYE